ncbi:MAG: cation diffusion facilitator family transporter [Eubacteriales bacterium]|nr:cation diffusion facilitator family transporter [Eubacteriales bacterium]
MDKQKREQIITRTSIIGILVNLLSASAKILIGLAASSIAIVSEGINNAADVLSLVITLVGTKLSAKHPDEDHPFGYGRIEYLTTMILAVLILYAGYELAKESIVNIIHPAKMSVTILSVAVVVASAIVKYFLGMYTIKMGEEAESGALDALGKDCRNDSFFSILTVVASVLYMTAHISIDGFAGLIFAFIILKTGYETMKDAASDIIGSAGKEDLAKDLYREIRKTDGVIHAVDLMLHSYGPDNYSGSVNIEVDHNLTVGEIYEVIHDLQLRIMHEYNVTMVFGIYAVDHDSEDAKEMRKYIAEYVRGQEHVKSYHALYISPTTDKIYVDFIVDYELRDWDAVSADFTEYMKKKYPERELELVIETEYV